MTIKEADQFAVDPLPDVNEKVLVNAEWLQNLIRERDSIRTEIKLLRTTHKKTYRRHFTFKTSINDL